MIRSDEPSVPHSRVTLAIALPSSVATPGAWLIGEGTVVRSAAAAGSGSTFAVAAEFELARQEDTRITSG